MSVTTSDVLAEIQRAPNEVQDTLMQDKNTLRKVVENIYLRKAMAAQAEAAFVQRPDIKQELQLQRERSLAEILLTETAKKGALSTETALSYARTLYRAEPEKYMAPPAYRVRQIYFPAPNSDELCTARQRATETLERLRDGADFVVLAAQHAKDVDSSIKGGDLGFISAEVHGSDFAAALSQLNTPGQISDMVVTSGAVLLLRLEEKREAKLKPFDEVKEELVKIANAQAAARARSNILKSIMESGQGDPEKFDDFATYLHNTGIGKK